MFAKLAPQILSEIKQAKRILLHFHPQPDFDSVGSSLALAQAIEGNGGEGKTITVIAGDSSLDPGFNIFPGYERVLAKSWSEIKPADFDLFLILDSSGPKRVSNLSPVTFPPTLRTILIDHHQVDTNFTDLALVLTDFSSTAEIIYRLLESWSWLLNHDSALCLYLGIYGDTGGFKFTRTTSDTLTAAATLAKLAPDFPEAIFYLENNREPGELIFLGLMLTNINHYYSNRVALSALSYEQLKSAGLVLPDGTVINSDNVSNLLKSVKGWDIGATLVEKSPGVVKASFRTRDAKRFNLATLAKSLGGGGHAAAAGAMLAGSLGEAKTQVLAKVKELFDFI